MSVGFQTTDSVVCHCYAVTEGEIRRVIETGESRTVEEVRRNTLAGGGCTACQCRIQRMLAGLPATCGLYELCDRCGCGTADCVCRVQTGDRNVA